MAWLLRRLHRCFHRKPVRFFTFFLLYLMAGSLVFLHAVFTSDNAAQPNVAWNVARGSAGGVGKGTPGTARHTGISWTKDSTLHERGSDHTNSWNPDLKVRTIKESDDGRAKYIGCYADDIQKRTLKGASFLDYRKMTVFRCQDNCAESSAPHSAVMEFCWTVVVWSGVKTLTSSSSGPSDTLLWGQLLAQILSVASLQPPTVPATNPHIDASTGCLLRS